MVKEHFMVKMVRYLEDGRIIYQYKYTDDIKLINEKYKIEIYK